MFTWPWAKKEKRVINYRTRLEDDESWVTVEPKDAEIDQETIDYWVSESDDSQNGEPASAGRRLKAKAKGKSSKGRSSGSDDEDSESEDKCKGALESLKRHSGGYDGYVMVDIRQKSKETDQDVADQESHAFESQKHADAGNMDVQSPPERAEEEAAKLRALPPWPTETEGAPFTKPPPPPPPGPLAFQGLDSSYWGTTCQNEIDRLTAHYLHSKIEDAERFTPDQGLRHDKDLGRRVAAEHRRQYSRQAWENLDGTRRTKRVPDARPKPLPSIAERTPNFSKLPERLSPEECAEPPPRVYGKGEARYQPFAHQQTQRPSDSADSSPSGSVRMYQRPHSTWESPETADRDETAAAGPSRPPRRHRRQQSGQTSPDVVKPKTPASTGYAAFLKEYGGTNFGPQQTQPPASSPISEVTTPYPAPSLDIRRPYQTARQTPAYSSSSRRPESVQPSKMVDGQRTPSSCPPVSGTPASELTTQQHRQISGPRPVQSSNTEPAPQSFSLASPGQQVFPPTPTPVQTPEPYTPGHNDADGRADLDPRAPVFTPENPLVSNANNMPRAIPEVSGNEVYTPLHSRQGGYRLFDSARQSPIFESDEERGVWLRRRRDER